MALRSDQTPEGLQRLDVRNAHTLPRVVPWAPVRAGQRVPELFQAAAEDLARRLELRPEPQEAEVVVPAGVHPTTELRGEPVERRPGVRAETRRPAAERLSLLGVHAAML